MSNCAVVGINWGDEGKGRMVDLIAKDYDIVIRYQGGNNAGLPPRDTRPIAPPVSSHRNQTGAEHDSGVFRQARRAQAADVQAIAIAPGHQLRSAPDAPAQRLSLLHSGLTSFHRFRRKCNSFP